MSLPGVLSRLLSTFAVSCLALTGRGLSPHGPGAAIAGPHFAAAGRYAVAAIDPGDSVLRLTSGNTRLEWVRNKEGWRIKNIDAGRRLLQKPSGAYTLLYLKALSPTYV